MGRRLQVLRPSPGTGHGGPILLLLALTAPGVAEPLVAQLPGPSASAPGMAGSSMASARGVAALGLNPAALALPSSPGWSLSFPSASFLSGLDPIRGTDLSGNGGKTLSFEERRDWLERITRAGGQRGVLMAEVTALALTTGPVGVQVGSVATGSTRLSPDAAELLLFGNAGLTGEPGDFQLAGSSLDGSVYTTAAGTVALPFSPLVRGRRQVVGVSATLKYTEGNVLLLGRDAGSELRGEPVAVALRFPMIQSDTSLAPVRNGGGLGMDLGLAWEGGSWSAGLTVENVFHTFRWDQEALIYRPGEALFDAAGNTSDFEPRPLVEGPPGLQDLVEELRFHPGLGVGVAHGSATGTVVALELRHRFGDGIALGPRQQLGLGVEHHPWSFLPLRTGVALVTDGWRGSMGAGLRMGAVEIQASALLQRGEVGSATLLAFGITAAGR
jgi:hypothetical protein